MLMALVPDEDVLAGLFEAPQEIAIKVSDLYARFQVYIDGLSDTRFRTTVDVCGFRVDRYRLKPTGKRRLEFIEKVVAGSFNLGFTYGLPKVTLDARAFYKLVERYAPRRILHI